MALEVLDGPVVEGLTFRRVPIETKKKTWYYEIDLDEPGYGWRTLFDAKGPARFYDRSTAARAARRYARDRVAGKSTRYTV